MSHQESKLGRDNQSVAYMPPIDITLSVLCLMFGQIVDQKALSQIQNSVRQVSNQKAS